MKSHDVTYKSFFFLSVLFDIILCSALLVSLIYYFAHEKSFSTHYIVGFSAFFILFAIFLISLIVATKTRRSRAILITVAVTVARFLCAIIIVIAWMSDYGGSSEDEKKIVNDSEKPYNWISNRKGFLIGFTAIYIPIFVLQLYVLNRYYSHSAERKRNQQFKFIG